MGLGKFEQGRKKYFPTRRMGVVKRIRMSIRFDKTELAGQMTPLSGVLGGGSSIVGL
jgi:hypothetical protein